MLDRSTEGAVDGADAQPSAGRRIWLCADDYGISPSVNVAIRDLLARRHINATSVMVVAPSFHRSEAVALKELRSHGARFAIGLHTTLSAPFQPLSEGFSPLRNGAFPRLGTVFARACLRQLPRDALAREIAAQVRMFTHTFGHSPDFIDGHQHVQLFPQVCDALFEVAKQMAPDAWIRQCGRAGVRGITKTIGDRKGLLLDLLSARFRKRAAEAGVSTNTAFAGTYDFTDDADFAKLFPRFLHALPDGGLVMCHPGLVDQELRRLDRLLLLREREYSFLAAPEFPKFLANHGVRLA